MFFRKGGVDGPIVARICWMLSNDGVFRKSLGIQFQYLHIAKNFLQVVCESLLRISRPVRMVKLGDRSFYSCGDFDRS